MLNRFFSIFDVRNKKRSLASMLILMLILSTLGLCISCTQNNGSGTGDMITYENETLGFSLKFPGDWEDKYLIEETDNNIAVFQKETYEKDEGGGLLFSIERLIGELITKEDMEQAPTSEQIVLQGNGYTYFKRLPPDVQYPPEDEKLSSEYRAMFEQVSGILHSISILGDKKPEAINEGYRVVGTSFFIAEIPADWELKPLEEFPIYWGIYAGDNKVGSIDLIPYKSERENTANPDIMTKYLINDERYRTIRITLDEDHADPVIMEKIKNSFEFIGGPYNVVDLQSAAEEYIAGGGKKVFGKIEAIEIENDNPIAVHVKVMKFIPDGPDGESPNGFQIEDLKQTKTYSLDFGVTVAPLVAPNYTNYGVYEMLMLDGSFIQNYENYGDYFYDFIIGRDGQLKIILGHYVP